jgi:hypothetical protein
MGVIDRALATAPMSAEGSRLEVFMMADLGIEDPASIDTLTPNSGRISASVNVGRATERQDFSVDGAST